MGLTTAMKKLFLAASFVLAALSAEAMASERFQYFSCRENILHAADEAPWIVVLDRTEGRIQLGGGPWSEPYSVKWKGNKVEHRTRGDGYKVYLRLDLTSGYIIHKADFWKENFKYKYEGECRMTYSR
tara:strand:- start:273 stop:656 length:384 start_codon:yes stop_codon:yes gene_type:complete